MSDFLDNLIGRSYGLKPVAQPRLASRFEPVQGNDAQAIQETALESEEFLAVRNEAGPEATFVSDERESDAAPPVKRSQNEEGLPQDFSQPPQDFSQRASRLTADSNENEAQQHFTEMVFETEDASQPFDASVAARTDNQPHATQTIEEMREAAKPLNSSQEEKHSYRLPNRKGRTKSLNASQEDSQEEKHATPVAATDRERAPERETLSSFEQHNISAQAGQGLKESSFVSDERSSSNINVSDEQTSSSIKPESVKPDTDLAHRTVAPARIAAQSNAQEGLEKVASAAVESSPREAAETSSPTIRVTIGRIDVRAVLPDSNSTQRPSSAPARKTHGPLSLEEYLKQRQGRER